eukprot:1537721-Karenia_brevis.AAC.1
MSRDAKVGRRVRPSGLGLSSPSKNCRGVMHSRRSTREQSVTCTRHRACDELWARVGIHFKQKV